MMLHKELTLAALGSAPWEARLQEWEPFQKNQRALSFARVFSPTNIALAKYWGKRDVTLNLPTNGSLSATLAKLGSFTTVAWTKEASEHLFFLNGSRVYDGKANRVFQLLDLIAQLKAAAPGAEPADKNLKAFVCSENNFPTAAGLASSASGFSALALAACTALNLDLSLTKISELARRGSGSACRSLFGGFVEWECGNNSDGSDSVAKPILSAEEWPLDAHILVVQAREKSVASTGGMEHTRKTSPYFESWIRNAQSSVATIRSSVLAKDFNALARETEANCLRFHSSAMAAEPGILYWRGETLECMHLVREMREQEGLEVFFTIDAGPNVVVFCSSASSSLVKARMQEFASAMGANKNLSVISTSIGSGARIFSKHFAGQCR